MPVCNAISVDVEDYFHTEAMTQVAPRANWDAMPSRVCQSTHLVLDDFAEQGVRGTFFFLGWVAERYPELVRRAVAEGHEIACHSYWHRAVFRLSREEFREDTYRAKSVIEQHAQVAVEGYRAPSFSITGPAKQWAYEVLEGLDFRYDSSVNPVRHGFYGNHHANRHASVIGAGGLLEFPIATWKMMGSNVPVGGGAYLRIFPYMLMQRGISAMNRQENAPAVVYFHPWEIDEGQPRLKASTKSRLRQYVGLGRMRRKLIRLMKEHSFAPIREAFAQQLSPQFAVVQHAAD